MPELPIWQFPALTTPALVDLLSVVSGGVSKKLALSDFATALAVSDVVVQTKTVGSGTYTPTARMKKVLAIAVGAGGAGAGGVNTDSAGGGGGGGGTVIRLLTAAQIGVSKAYVVGSGSSGAGTATTLDGGTLMNAGGGGVGVAGATFSVIGVQAAGGAGGTAAGGDLNIPGMPGERGVILDGNVGVGGAGGRSLLGLGGVWAGTNLAGNPGQSWGGGGAGGHASATQDRAGGNGANGFLYLLEFLG